MATSDANICNKALVRLGVRGAFLDDLNTDQTDEAEIFAAVYEDVRDACLAAFPWPFATLRKTLVQIDPAVEPTRDGWSYVYAVPADALQERRVALPGHVRNVIPDQYNGWYSGQTRAAAPVSRVAFTVEKSTVDDSRVLLCDLPEAVLFYTAKVTDPTKFPPLFVDALAWLLAAETAIAVTSKSDKETVARRNYLMKISEARAVAFSGVQEDQNPDPEAISGRL